MWLLPDRCAFLCSFQVVKSLGLDIQAEELQGMIDEFDLDKDGMISQAEFVAMLMSDDWPCRRLAPGLKPVPQAFVSDNGQEGDSKASIILEACLTLWSLCNYAALQKLGQSACANPWFFGIRMSEFVCYACSRQVASFMLYVYCSTSTHSLGFCGESECRYVDFAVSVLTVSSFLLLATFELLGCKRISLKTG